MILPKIFKKSEPEKAPSLFLAILLTDETVHSAVWRVVEEEIIISHRSQVHFFQDDNHLEKIDLSLQDLGPDSEKTDDVLFGFEPSWATGSGIIDTKKHQLKNITEKLSLNAVGYVVITEAIYQHLISSNKMLSTVILYITRRSIELNLVRQGKMTARQSAGRSQNIVADLKEVIARLRQADPDLDQLPPNVALASGLIDSTKLEEYQQQLIDQNWADELGFLQEPVIKVIGQEKVIDILVREGGQAVAQSKGLIAADDSMDLEQPGAKKTDVDTNADGSQATSFGVPVRPEALDSQRAGASPSAASDQPAAAAKLKNQETAVPDHFKQKHPLSGSKATSLKKRFKRRKKRSSPPSPKSPGRKRGFPLKTAVILGVITGALALIGVGYWLLAANYTAKIIVTPQTESISKDERVILTEDRQATQSGQLSLQAKAVYQTAAAEKTKATTGVKLIGEKAEGKVTIFNKTEEEKTFGQDVVFTNGELEFTLKEAATIPAAVAEENEEGDGEIKEYGQKEAVLAASEIGAESNLEEDSEFQIADFSENTYSAKAEENFSGGSSREIRVVSEEDRTGLLSELSSELAAQAQQEMEEQTQESQYFVPTDSYEIRKQEFSAEVGDEVEELSLNLELELKGLSYTSEDIKPLAIQSLSAELPEGLQLKQDKLDILSEQAEQTEQGIYSFSVNFTAPAAAEVDQQQLHQAVQAKPIDEAKAVFNETESVDQAEIKLQPWIASLIFKNLPKQAERIEIEVRNN